MGDSGVAVTQAVEARVCPRYEDLVPLTEEQADALTDIQAGERMQAIGEHCRGLIEKARTIMLRFLPEIRSMRRRYSQPGRRNPIPGFPTWGEFSRRHFPFSPRHLRRLLTDPKPEESEGSVIDVEVEEGGAAQETAAQTEPAPADAEEQEPETPPEAAASEAQETPETGKPGRRERPS